MLLIISYTITSTPDNDNDGMVAAVVDFCTVDEDDGTDAIASDSDGLDDAFEQVTEKFDAVC